MLPVQGSTLQAGNRAALDAQDEIKLLAARNTADQHSTNKSINGSVGVSLGSDGLLFTASASGARGNADGSDVTWTNTHVNAGDQVVMTSGGDTIVKGAVVKAPQIIANVGGNLNVESLQDTSKFDSKQQSIGGSVSFGYGKGGGSFSASNSKVDSDFASVVEQSGFRAGDKGFNVKVAKNTDLKGGAITSTQKAIDDNKNNTTSAFSKKLDDVAAAKAKEEAIAKLGSDPSRYACVQPSEQRHGRELRQHLQARLLADAQTVLRQLPAVFEHFNEIHRR